MSIFDEKNKIKGDYFAFKVIGDKLEGTYVGKRITVNRLKQGAEQNVYEIKKLDGTFIEVYGKPGIDMQMKRIKLGQIVGFEFIKIIPPTQPGYKPTHVIQVYADPKEVDEKWLTEKEEEASSAEGVVEPNFNATAEQPSLSTEELLAEINNLAITKLGAKTPEEVKQMVMEKTNLAFLEHNLATILETLQQLP